MTITLALRLPRAFERLLDGPSDDELATEDAHRRGYCLPDNRLPRAGDKTAQRAAQIALPRLAVQQPAGQHQRPGRGIDKNRFGPSEMTLPIRLADLVADQPVDCLDIRHPE